MKPRLLDLLGCPQCNGPLTLGDAVDAGHDITSGTLTCADCGRTYPIRGSIPRLLPDVLDPAKQKTADAFGWQWLHFVEMHDHFEAQFLDWIWPIQPDYFRGKVIMDAGCGMGRHAHFAAMYGSTEVVAIDFSASVETAFKNIGHLPNVHIIQGDIDHPPFRLVDGSGDFDFIYSIGVLQFLPDPEHGFRSLARFLKPKGEIYGWVYGHENNALIHHFFAPLRKHVTSRLRPSILRAVAWPLAVALIGAIRALYVPLHGTRLYRRLPQNDYMYSIHEFPFRYIYNIVFDHLVAPTAVYLRKEEFQAWFENVGLESVELTWRNQNSWRGRGRRREIAAEPQPRHVPGAQS